MKVFSGVLEATGTPFSFPEEGLDRVRFEADLPPDLQQALDHLVVETL